MSDTNADQMDMFQRWAAGANDPLHPDLEPYMEVHDRLGRMLRHPLVFSVPFFSAAMANEQYAYKKKALARAIADEDWHQVVFLHERPYRMSAFVEYVLKRDPVTGALPALVSFPEGSVERELAASVWTDSENIHENEGDWGDLFADWMPGDGPVLMDDEGVEVYAGLPDTVEVWRGCARDTGFSWTLERDIAEFFMNRSMLPARLYRAVVPKSHVMGVVFGRGESEVLIRRDLLDPQED